MADIKTGKGNLQILGTRELMEQLLNISEDFKENVKEAIKESVDVMHAEALSRVPVRDGILKKSIVKGFSESGLTGRIRAGAGKGSPSPAFHVALVEFGTKKMKAKPFLRPAHDKASQGFEAKVVAAFNQATEANK